MKILKYKHLLKVILLIAYVVILQSDLPHEI